MTSDTVGPPSFWLARRRDPLEVEVAVVGGGIVGLSTAWWLARSGRKPLLLEAGHLAGRASGRNAGFLMTGTPETYVECERHLGPEAAEAFWRLSADNRDLLRAELLDPSARGKIDCAFQPEGSWIAAAGQDGEDDTERDELRASAERLRELGFDVEWREGDAVSQAAGSPRIRAALHQPRDGGLDPVLLCRGVAGRAVEAGAAVRTGARVRSIRSMEPHPRGVVLETDGGDVLAERVVVALNAYASALLPELTAKLRPVRGQMMALGPDPAGGRAISGVWYLDRGFQYVRELADGTVLVGGCRLAAEMDERGYREHPTATVQGALERFAAATYPHLAGRPVVRRWAGVMANTASGLPEAGETGEESRVPGVVYAAGMNGHGMSLGFATGRWLARRALGETAEPLLPPPRPTAL